MQINFNGVDLAFRCHRVVFERRILPRILPKWYTHKLMHRTAWHLPSNRELFMHFSLEHLSTRWHYLMYSLVMVGTHPKNKIKGGKKLLNHTWSLSVGSFRKITTTARWLNYSTQNKRKIQRVYNTYIQVLNSGLLIINPISCLFWWFILAATKISAFFINRTKSTHSSVQFQAAFQTFRWFSRTVKPGRAFLEIDVWNNTWFH